MSNLNICLFPMEIRWEDKKLNFSRLQAACREIHPDTDLLILPETFSTGFPSGVDKEHVRAMAERNTEKTVDFLKYLAYKHNIAIAGSFIANSGGSLYNRAFFIEPSGEETFADKRHLFTMAGEHECFSRGHERMAVRYRGWNIAMVVCYDIRFPAWCRNVGNEYDLLIAVANWPQVRVDAWNQLLRARAIENEAYVAGVNCVGEDLHGIVYDGSSLALDFKGKDIGVRPATQADAAPAGGDSSQHAPGYIYASLSKEKLDRFREKFPAWRDADDFRLL